MKDSIRRLKELRNTLCSEQSVWKEAFATRDQVITDLIDVYKTCLDKKSRKKQIEKKLLSIFEYLHVDPNVTGGE